MEQPASQNGLKQKKSLKSILITYDLPTNIMNMKAKLLRSEYDECVALVEYLKILRRQGHVVGYSHIPNSTYTPSWAAKNKNKALGVASGFPDYVILGRGKLIFLEMKKEKGGIVSLDQKAWLFNLSVYRDVVTKVCRGFNEAQKFLKEELIDA